MFRLRPVGSASLQVDSSRSLDITLRHVRFGLTFLNQEVTRSPVATWGNGEANDGPSMYSHEAVHRDTIERPGWLRALGTAPRTQRLCSFLSR